MWDLVSISEVLAVGNKLLSIIENKERKEIVDIPENSDDAISYMTNLYRDVIIQKLLRN